MLYKEARDALDAFNTKAIVVKRDLDTQRQTETNRDTQRHTETHRDTQRHTETHRDTQRHTEALWLLKTAKD